MSRYSAPRRRKILHAARRGVNSALDAVRAPIRKPGVALITGDSEPGKVQEVETRLRFLFDHLESPVEIRRNRSAHWASYLRNATVAAVEASEVPRLARRHLRWVVDLDYETNPTDGWALMDLGVELSRRSPSRDNVQARRIFNKHIRTLKAEGPRPVYLFGTGPSLELAARRPFDDGTTIACNTIVRDPELWRHLSPAFLTAGDAIYHFGHTPHAYAFRADALKRLRESNGRTLFVYPDKFDVVVRSEFRDVQELLVPIPIGDHRDLTVDLTEHFELPRLGNVLNGLLLPMGCTLSRDIRLWGFDGRAPNDRGFWANSNRHAYPELMQSIRDAHPAFFAQKTPKGREDQYVNKVHGDLLDERLTEAESRGFQFKMLHHSWTPTLQKRYFDLGSGRG